MFWVPAPGGFRLYLRLTPKASRDALGGVEVLSDGRTVLRAYVRAVPEDGKANEALVRVLAAALDIGRSAIELESGATSRLKCFFIRTSRELGARFAQMAEVQPKSK